MTSSLRPRGRPRAYDPQTALARARDTFWHKGYAGTSLDDLATAMGMNRPSVYAAFGDKQALYMKTLQRYAQSSCAALERGLAAPGTLRNTLLSVFAAASEFYLAGDRAEPRGCYLLGTGLTEALPNRQVRKIMNTTFEAFTKLFERRLQQAAGERELHAAADPHALALIATATLNALALRARAGASRNTLAALSAATVDVICTPRRP